MAKIIENVKGRRQIKLNFADIQAVIKEYQIHYARFKNVTDLCNFFEFFGIFLPEDV